MNHLILWVATFLKSDRRAVTALEYGLIAVVIITGVTTIGTNLAGKFNAVATATQ